LLAHVFWFSIGDCGALDRLGARHSLVWLWLKSG
jgi:hypothetical protein